MPDAVLMQTTTWSKCWCRTKFFLAFRHSGIFLWFANSIHHQQLCTKIQSVSLSIVSNGVYPFFFFLQFLKCRNAGLSGTRIRGPSPVPECSGTGMRCRGTECQCQRQRACKGPSNWTVRLLWLNDVYTVRFIWAKLSWYGWWRDIY